MAAASARSLLLVLSVLAAFTLTPQAQGSRGESLPLIQPNDNRVPAGRLSAETLDLTITARVGRWFPDGQRRPAPLLVAAFAGPDGVPSIPGPLIRVRAGTRIRLTVQNALDGPLAGAPLIVHGLHPRPAADDAPLRVEPGTSREAVFQAGEPGTYYYWASTSDSATVATRGGADSQLTGAIVVDPASGPVPPDRIFVLGRMTLPAEGSGATRQPDRFVVTVNGLSWPLTERLGAAVDDTVHWRWINATNEHHP
ncbi:MAG TPA: multicopper oxidase domain-containing protein, partial [Longimicrobium sp.]|nr:multicopper oxidase domain-containing protein [Longimicrobium sp.]